MAENAIRSETGERARHSRDLMDYYYDMMTGGLNYVDECPSECAAAERTHRHGVFNRIKKFIFR